MEHYGSLLVSMGGLKGLVQCGFFRGLWVYGCLWVDTRTSKDFYPRGLKEVPKSYKSA